MDFERMFNMLSRERGAQGRDGPTNLSLGPLEPNKDIAKTTCRSNILSAHDGIICMFLLFRNPWAFHPDGL
jgi:hypothetical protein